MLKRNLGVECVDVILGHNVEYSDSKSELPILVLEGSKRGHLERIEIWLFQSVQHVSRENPGPQTHRFPGDSLPGLRPSGAVHKCKKPVSGLGVYLDLSLKLP